MIPVDSNVKGKECANPTTSDCVQLTVGSNCLDLCKGATVTDGFYQMDKLLCSLSTDLDLSTLDLKCLCGAGELKCCPVGWTLVQLSDGSFACRNDETGLVSVKTLIPCPATPCSTDLSLVNVLQLMINKSCNCCP